MQMRMYVSSLTGVVLGLLAVSATAETIALTPAQDNTIYEDFPENTCGAGLHIISGLTKNDSPRRALLRFDIEAAGIPDNSVINSVTLTLRQNRTEDNQSATMRLHPLTRAWGEGNVNCNLDNDGGKGFDANPGDATWPDANFQQTPWTSPGGDFGAASASAVVTNQTPSNAVWSSTDPGNGAMAADVQGWLDNPATNFGWILIGDETRPGPEPKTARRFNSSEGSPDPELVINFTPPVQLFACCFTDGDCSVLTTTACTMAGGTTDMSTDSCVPNMCPQPLGACCNLDESCDDGVARDACELQGGTFQGAGSLCTDTTFDCGLEPFVDALPLPGVMSPIGTRPDGVPQYEITIQTAAQKLHTELPPTTLWTYGGKYPADSFETRVGEPIEVTWINGLPPGGHLFAVDECAHGPNYYGNSPRVVTHLHGGHVPARVDGQPEYTLLPGELDIYEYPNNQLPATMWYHDHALGITRLNVYGGMAGFYLLRDDVEDALALPAGEFELPLVIQDRQIDLDTGALIYPESLVNSFFGDKVLVNGKVWPVTNVKQGKYRLRIINGSQARTYSLRLENLADAMQSIPFTLIGTDLGLISAPLQLDTIEMVTAERFDVIVDFAGFPAGTEIVLRNDNLTDPQVPNVMKFVVTAEPGFVGAIPATLRPVTPIPEIDAVATRWFRLEKIGEPCSGNEWLIRTLDGPSGTPTGAELWDDLSEFVRLDTTEIWEFENPSSAMHPMHIHLVAFQVLDRSLLSDGSPLPLAAHEANTWKDTVRVDSGTRVRVIARFEDYLGRFSYHCHILDHEDHEMMRQFVMVNDPANCDLDGVCEAGEDAVGCADCAHVSGASCGNGLCEIGDGEDCVTCPADCNGDQTGGGSDFCCGNGGTNPIGCGVDDMDDRCLDAPALRFCRVMPRVSASCGDRLCEGEETVANCAQDCLVPACEPTELTDELSCDDGQDNDCDGFVDSADTDCPAPDTDGDGVGDDVDNCITFANPGQEDTNGDGIGNACDADLNDDCGVNFADLAALKAVFFPAPYSADADFNSDGFVNFGDLARLKQTFFNGDTPGPGPSAQPNACSD